MKEWIFQSVLIAPCCFLEKETFWGSFASCFLQWRSWLHYECVRISALKYCLYHTGHLLAFENGHKSTQARYKFCENLTKCTTTIGFCLTSVFFINLQHHEHPTLVLLFILWKSKCCLKMRPEFFVKIIQWC